MYRAALENSAEALRRNVGGAVQAVEDTNVAALYRLACPTRRGRASNWLEDSKRAAALYLAAGTAVNSVELANLTRSAEEVSTSVTISAEEEENTPALGRRRRTFETVNTLVELKVADVS